MRRTCTVWLIVGLSWSAALPAGAQVVQEIPSQPSCGECAVRLTSVFALEDSIGNASLETAPDVVARDVLGQLYLVVPAGVKVFDSSGSFLRLLEGTGSEASISEITPHGDHVHIFDSRADQQLVFHVNGEALDRTALPPRVDEVVFHEGERALYNARITTADAIGLLFHRFDASGQAGPSFGETDEVFMNKTVHDGRRELAPAGDGRFWAAYPNRYWIEEWDLEGVRKRRLVRRAEWFPSHVGGFGFSPDHPPRPMLVDLQADGRGRLWVVAAVADQNWRNALISFVDDAHGGEVRYVPEDINGYFDTMVEVVDPGSGRLLLSSRFDAFLRFVGPGHVYSVSEAEGRARLNVWQLDVDDGSEDADEDATSNLGSIRALSHNEIQMLRLGVRGHPEGILNQVLARWPQRVVYVPERNALQARGCQDATTIHIPLHVELPEKLTRPFR